MKKTFQDLEASELFCPNCKKPQPVRKKLLIVLADQDKYDYICTVCGETIGMKTDDRPGNFGPNIK